MVFLWPEGSYRVELYVVLNTEYCSRAVAQITKTGVIDHQPLKPARSERSVYLVCRDRCVQTLGFALAKELIRGLTCCPNPSSKIPAYYPFLDVSRCGDQP